MKQLLIIAIAVIGLSSNAIAQPSALGKPTSSDSVQAAGTYTMAINPSSISLTNKKQLLVHFTATKIDSVKGYVKLQCKINGSFADIGTNPGDSTMVTLQNVAGSKGYTLRAPASLSPLLGYDNWQLLLVVPTPAKFRISGDWVAK